MSKEIPIASTERILKKMGAERVAENAKRAFRDYMEVLAEQIAEKIVRATRNTRRKTVRICDMAVIDEKFIEYRPKEPIGEY